MSNTNITSNTVIKSTTVISSTTVKRIISDIKQITLNPLTKDGIYYKHDESNMLSGYALIIGPKDTPYEYGNFLFKFDFPENYPYSPPRVTYYTNDGKTRFNPNLYRNGKVCISLLNTWKGEQWTGCQTISSILLVLCTLLNDKPLLNEPGITEKHKDHEAYNKIIKYKTIEIAISKMLIKNTIPEMFYIFYEDIVENFIKNFNYIIDDIKNKDDLIISCSIYNLSIKTSYKDLNEKLINHFTLLNK
tara:strand:+ start:326 stop:1066 length:741 start_codon:yes stop_codon:yes gene_type:complete